MVEIVSLEDRVKVTLKYHDILPNTNHQQILMHYRQTFPADSCNVHWYGGIKDNFELCIESYCLAYFSFIIGKVFIFAVKR